MNHLTKLIFLSFCVISQPTLAMTSNNGETYWGTVKCGGVTANLMVNHRTIAQPTLFLNSTAIKLEDGPDYRGPVCVTYRGEKKVGYVESMGNAYEVYYMFDLDTFKRTKIDYSTAKKIGF